MGTNMWGVGFGGFRRAVRLGAVAFVFAMWCIDEAECPSTSASRSMRLWSGRGSGVERMTRCAVVPLKWGFIVRNRWVSHDSL